MALMEVVDLRHEDFDDDNRKRASKRVNTTEIDRNKDETEHIEEALLLLYLGAIFNPTT